MIKSSIQLKVECYTQYFCVLLHIFYAHWSIKVLSSYRLSKYIGIKLFLSH